MSSLLEFLVELSINPGKLSEYVANQRAAMESAGVDRPSQDALLSGSAAAIWSLLSGLPVDVPEATAHDTISSRRRGELVVVGTGIRTVGQLTPAAIAWIKEASVVYYIVADPIAEATIRRLNPSGAISLRGHYNEGGSRIDSYEAMVTTILESVRDGHRTCVALYGHPGVFAYPSHESVRRARAEGFQAMMLPAISAEDCLFADLGVDPSVNGCQSYEATDFLLHNRTVDVSSQLVLWQIGVVGDVTYRSAGYSVGNALPLLVAKLVELYGEQHVGVVYEAPMLPGLSPSINAVNLSKLLPSHVNAQSTLYVPPARGNSLNREVAKLMGLIS